MLVVAWRQAPSPRAAIAALGFVSLFAAAEAPAAPIAGDATALQVVRWEPQRASKAALANLYSNLTAHDEAAGPPPPPIPGDASALQVVRWEPQRAPQAATAALYRSVALEPSSTALAPPEPESVSTPPPIQWRPGRTPPAATRNLYGNVALEPSSSEPPVPPVLAMGDASALMVVRWEPQQAPRAALAALYRWNTPADELEPYPDATAITVIAWKGSAAPRWARAALRNLYGQVALEPSSTVVVTPEPESLTAPPATRWKPGRAPRAALRVLYGNVALEPSSTVAAPEPDSVSTVPRDVYRAPKTPRAALRNLYGNQALEPSSTTAPIPDSVTTPPAIRWQVPLAPLAALAALYRNTPGEAPIVVPPDTGPRGAIPPVIVRWKTWRAPRAALAALYRYARFDYDTGPEPVIVLDRLRIEFWAQHTTRTFTANTAPTFVASRQAKVFVAQGELEVVRGPSTDEFTAGETGG